MVLKAYKRSMCSLGRYRYNGHTMEHRHAPCSSHPRLRPHAGREALYLDGYATEEQNLSTFDWKPYWDLHTIGGLIMLAYHRCEVGQAPLIARYHILSREYECLHCGAKHPALIGTGDQLLSSSDQDHYIGFTEPSGETQAY